MNIPETEIPRGHLSEALGGKATAHVAAGCHTV